MYREEVFNLFNCEIKSMGCNYSLQDDRGNDIVNTTAYSVRHNMSGELLIVIGNSYINAARLLNLEYCLKFVNAVQQSDRE